MLKTVAGYEIVTTAPLAGWKIFVTWVARIFVGAVFAFSGIAKAIDPWGTIYKLSDYLAVMDISFVSPTMVLTGAFLLFSVEFLTGVFLLTGSFRRSAPILVLLFMVVMLPLTLWIALKNPVPDCGCFGDALVISNTATFWKNVVLTVAGVWLVVYNRRVHWLITPALQWIGFVVTALFIVPIGFVGYKIQPVIDFRGYKTGGPLVTADSSESTTFTFVYEKDGVRHEFSETDSLPDEQDGWQFVERREHTPQSAVQEERELRIWSEDGEEDVTDDVMAQGEERQFVLMIPDMTGVSIASTWKINSLKQWADSRDIDFIAVVAATAQEIEKWKDMSMAEYPIYTAEDTSIKEVVRGNPAIVYTDGGRIVWKSTLVALVDEDYMDADTETEPENLYIDLRPGIRNLTLVYLGVIAVLILFSFSPKVLKNCYNMFRCPKRRTKCGASPEVNDDDKARHEE